MNTMTAEHTIRYNAREAHTSILSQWIQAYKEAFQANKAAILCGITAAGGSTHLYPMYSQLKENAEQ